MAQNNGQQKGQQVYYADGSFDWSGGVDSSKVTTVQSALNPNGLARNQLSWLINGTVRGNGISQRAGFQPLFDLAEAGYWQGGVIYEPDNGYPYLVCQIDGMTLAAMLVPPYTVRNLSALFNLYNPADPNVAEMAFFCQGENFLVIQAGDYYTNPNADPTGFMGGPSPTLPLFWNGQTLRRSIGIQSAAPAMQPGINELPAGTCMEYYGGHFWIAQARQVTAGDMVGGPSGTAGNHRRDSILNVTENPLCFGGDGFSVPTNSGNIRALAAGAAINAPNAQGQFFIFTRKSVYALTVPTTRTDWIGADNSNQPQMTVAQINNGAVGHRCIVKVNGDVFYQSFEPGVRSMIIAQRYFQQWANTPISQNESRALARNNRGLMRFSSGIEYDNRMLQAVLPEIAADGVNIVHRAVLPMDFDQVSNLSGTAPPVWEGAYGDLAHVELFTGDFGGLPRAFSVAISDEDGSFKVWELPKIGARQNGDNRVTWLVDFPAFTWANSGLEHKLKRLSGGEFWVDQVDGKVSLTVYYRVDADPCWHLWHQKDLCAARCEEQIHDPIIDCAYPTNPPQRGYVFPVVLPEAKGVCDSMGVRPTTNAYQFQVRVVLTGFLRIRGLLLYAWLLDKPQFQGIACPTELPRAMATLPNPFR